MHVNVMYSHVCGMHVMCDLLQAIKSTHILICHNDMHGHNLRGAYPNYLWRIIVIMTFGWRGPSPIGSLPSFYYSKAKLGI